MNKTQFIDYITTQHNISKVEAEKITNLFINSITSALSSGEEINLTGFGRFYTSQVEEKTGRNPKTGKELIITAYKQAKFSAGKSLKGACNGK